MFISINIHKKFLSFIFTTLSFSFFSFSASSEEEELSFSQLSNYSENAQFASNTAFIFEQEGDRKEASPYLQYAARRHVRCSLFSYASYLMEEERLKKTKTPFEDLRLAANYILMAAIRKDEEANDYLRTIYENIQPFYQSKEGEDLLTTLENTVEEKSLLKWLKASKNIDEIPSVEGDLQKVTGVGQDRRILEDAIDLCFLGLLKALPNDVIKNWVEKIGEFYTHQFRTKKDAKISTSTPVRNVYFYAHEVLKIDISDTANYDNGGEGKYKYYNPKHKIPYLAEVILQYFCGKHSSPSQNASEPGESLGEESLFLREKKLPVLDPKGKRAQGKQKKAYFPFTTGTTTAFFTPASCAAAAGPYFKELFEIEKDLLPEDYSIPANKVFFLNPLLKILGSFFVGKNKLGELAERPDWRNRSLWLVELTHLEEPWKTADRMLDPHKLEGKWPTFTEEEQAILKVVNEKRINNLQLSKAEKLVCDKSEILNEATKIYRAELRKIATAEGRKSIEESLLFRLGVMSIYQEQKSALEAMERASAANSSGESSSISESEVSLSLDKEVEDQPSPKKGKSATLTIDLSQSSSRSLIEEALILEDVENLTLENVTARNWQPLKDLILNHANSLKSLSYSISSQTKVPGFIKFLKSLEKERGVIFREAAGEAASQ